MNAAQFSPAALAYLAEHGISPAVAARCDVREKGGGLVFPWPDADGRPSWRRRSLNGHEPRWKGEENRSPGMWWPAGRPERPAIVLVCEGGSDALAALTAAEHGSNPVLADLELAVVATPGTAGVRDRLADQLRELRPQEVAVAFDADEAGRRAGTTVIDALRTAGLRAYPIVLPDGDDLGDCLAREADPSSWLADVILEWSAAEDGRAEGESANADQPAAPGAAAGGPHSLHGREASSTLIDFTEIVAKPVRWAWRDRVALAKITALAGRPKIGKGLLYSHLIAQVTRGRLDGDLAEPRDVILVTTEDEPGDTLKPRLMAAGADLARVSIFQMGSKEEPVPFRVPQDADELGRRVAEKNAAVVIIDPLMEFIDGKVDSHKSHGVRQAVAALNAIAREHGCAVLVILHLNKGASTDPLLRHEGSAAFTQVVRGGLMLGHDPDDPAGDEGNQRVLAVSSSNLAPLARSLVYRIETSTVQGDTGEPIKTARMVHIGESEANGHDLLRDHGGDGERGALDDAKDFLEAELVDGQRLARDVTREAKGIGISERTLKRARGDLDVISDRLGEAGVRGGGAWYWSLPIKGAKGAESPHSVEAGPLNANPLVERDSGGLDLLRGPRPNDGPLNPASDDEQAEGLADVSEQAGVCSCTFPARSPRASGPDFCQQCRRPIADDRGNA